ncbi:MAG: hypothetical protein V2A74_14695, partial [bacterium]
PTFEGVWRTCLEFYALNLHSRRLRAELPNVFRELGECWGVPASAGRLGWGIADALTPEGVGD